ncbi:MAG: superfamily helicase [Ilumatobacteraceae bacterium]|nr:superfamily helicase [Ilumatobacteraceae bacterium]
MRADRAELIAHYTFPLDRFQIEAMDALDDGRSVLVAAPTGSGKTVVAEYGIEAALRAGKRAFYTAPIKALSNQKFRDLVERYGADQVGLLTGDNAINGDAPVVVMTTEVLRNMIYGRSHALSDLALVVLDEVHFLQDTYRGPVWEEVIIHLPQTVQLVCLSATVSNATELTDWITTVRGPTTAVLEEKRPVRLENLFMVGDKTSDRLHLLPTLVNGHPNHVAMRLTEEGTNHWQGGRRGGKNGSGHAKRKLYAPTRIEVVERLDAENMLPAIYFIFSRNQCDEAAKTCLAAGLRLIDGAQRERIREIIDARLVGMEPSDLAVLGYGQFLAQLEAGIAAHHAGMVPPFKEVVEACFAEGLIKVVFATETLAVGINMPARTVVVDKLTKFTGEHHAMLTPGQYTQLTGRAGRRGIDDHGQAVVLWNPFTSFDQVAGLASSRWFHLNSAFRPTYNMAANLVRTYTSEQAHHLLNLSFAQYQADGDVVRMESRLGKRQTLLRELTEEAISPYGDIDDYRRRLHQSERPAAHVVNGDDPIDLAIMKLRPGDVVYVRKGKYAGRAAVISTANRKGGMRLTTVTTRRDLLMLSGGDFDEPPTALGRIELPIDDAPNRTDYLKDTAQRLEKVRLLPQPDRRRPPTTTVEGYHPVEDDPDLKHRLKAAAQADRIAREVEELRSRVTGRSQSIARDFDRVLGILEAWGYVDGWTLTEAGTMLARTFHESDLLVVEVLRQGLLDGLDPATMAGLVSVFVYEHRSPDAPPLPWFPNNAVRKRWLQIAALSAELQAIETEDGLVVHRAPDPTFLAIAFAWAAGEGFAEVVEAEELTGGDFVRTIKQLIDLLRQLAIIAPVAATRRCAEQAAQALFRGVVAASSAVEIESDPAPGAVAATTPHAAGEPVA